MNTYEKQITVIVPVHMYNDDIKPLLDKALSTVERDFVKLIIATSPELANSPFCKLADNVVVDEDTRFANLVNKAVDVVDTKFFSILEFDDIYKLSSQTPGDRMKNVVFNSALAFADVEPNVSVFIPMVDIAEKQGESSKFIAFANEAPVMRGLTEKDSIIDEQSLDSYDNYTLTGAVFKTEDFKAIGKLKPSIQLTFWIEYIRRAIYNKQLLMVLPKNGYIHYIKRPGSLLDIYEHTMKKEEVVFWYKTSKEAYKDKEDAGFQFIEG